MPSIVTARLISIATWPPYTSWENMSTPSTLVPSQGPGENGGSLLTMMFPLVDEGSVTTSGSRKQMATSRMRTPAGTQSRSARPSRCARSRRALRREGSGGGTGGASIVSGNGAAIPDPWVEYRVGQVGQEVAEQGHERENQRDSLDEGRAVVGDAGQQVVADALHLEDRLDDGRRADQSAQVQPDHGDEVEHGIAQRVPGEDPPGRDALGLGRDDVVLALHLLDQVGPQQPGVDREQPEPDRAGGQGQVLKERAGAGHGAGQDREPVQLDRED